MSDSMTSATLPPPNWYPDNADPNLQRWWDGQRWSTHTAPVATPAVPNSISSNYSAQYAYTNPVTVSGVNSIATRAFVYGLIGLLLNPAGMMGIGAIVLGIRGMRRAPQFAAESNRHGFAVAAIAIGSFDTLVATFCIVSAISVYSAQHALGG
jgi:hypothetical protein